MKLNSKTRDRVKVGTHLCQPRMELVVINIIEERNGKLLTTVIENHPEKVWIGHAIYAQPISWYYGMKIKED